MQVIAISFTLKGQDFKSIKERLDLVKKSYPEVELVHGFMPKQVVKEKGFSTEVVDTLDEYFPNQKNFFGDREGMAQYVAEKNGLVLILGDVVEGVLEEYNLYKSQLPETNIRLIP